MVHPLLFRRLLLQSLFPLTLVASLATAQAAEGSETAEYRLTTFDPAGLSTTDEGLTFSENFEGVTNAEDTVPQATAPSGPVIDRAGPFFLVAPDTIEMIGEVDADTPRQFDRMMTRHPGVTRLVMVDCPGSLDERANHILARRVRAAGLATRVPRGGYVGSGAVDLFLAGTDRSADASAEFAVHSWRDDDGKEADDYAADDPANTEYVAYYRDMGLAEPLANKFYAITSSVPFDHPRILSAADMAHLGLARIAG